MRNLLIAILCLALPAIAWAQPAVAGPDAPQSLAALWPMLGVSLASLAAYGIRKLSSEYTFFHTGLGAFALALIGSVISSVTPVIQAHGLAWAALAWAAVGGLTSFVATLNPSTTADQPPAKSPAAAKLAALLPLLLLFGAFGCHGYKAPTYATLALMDEGADAATKATPPACETAENAAVDAAKAKVDAIAAVAVIHDRCGATLTVLEGIGKGVKTARNSVHDAPVGTLPPDVLSWIAALAKQYCDAVPLLAFFHITLPVPAGVC